MPDVSHIIKVLEDGLAEVRKELAEISDKLKRFRDPFPIRGDFPEGQDGTYQYLVAYDAHIEAHLNGEFSPGSMIRTADRKVALEGKRRDILNELAMKRGRSTRESSLV